MSIRWVGSVNGKLHDLVDDAELDDSDEVARKFARLLTGLVLFSVAMLVGLAVRMLLG